MFFKLGMIMKLCKEDVNVKSKDEPFFCKLFIVTLVLFNVCYANAYDTYAIKEGDTGESIARRNIEKVRMKYGERYHEYEEDIKKWNPLIIDWKHPPRDQLIYVDYPYDHYLQGSSWVPLLEKYDELSELDHFFSLNVFYASSFGSYKEQTSEQRIDSGQNFPLTIGLGFSLTNYDKIHLIVGSAYWAQPSKGKISSNSQNLNSDFTIPGEVGFNLYYQYYKQESSFGLYSGYDFEKLNTFNTSEFVSGASLNNIENKIHYGTIGALQGFSLLGLKMNLKASISKTVASSASVGKSLSGMKYILYFTVKPEGRFSFNIFYKHHELKGPTKLSIDRIGLGVSMLVF